MPGPAVTARQLGGRVLRNLSEVTTDLKRLSEYSDLLSEPARGHLAKEIDSALAVRNDFAEGIDG